MGTLDRWRPTRREVVDGGIVLALTTLGLLGFRSSYGGIEFLVVGLIGAALGLVVAHLLDRLRLPAVVSVAVSAAVFVVVGGAVALHRRAIAGLLPSIDTIEGALRTPVTGWKELITTNPPVGDVGTLLVLPVFCGYLAVLAATAVARRSRRSAFALVPSATVLCLGIATGTDRAVSIAAQGGVFGAVAVTWLAVGEERRRPRLEGQRTHRSRLLTGAAVLAGAAIVGVFLAPSLPMADAHDRQVWRAVVTPPFDPRDYPSPLSAYRKYVRADGLQAKPLFTIDGLPEDTLVRLATMDAYDGLVWRPSYRADEPTGRNSGYFERMGSTIESDQGGEVATLTVTIEGYEGVWVPDVGEVLSLRFEGGPRDDELNEQFRYNRSTDTAASRIGLTAGDRYVMTVRLPTKLDEIAGSTLVNDMSLVPDITDVPDLNTWAATPSLLAITDAGEAIDALVERFRTEGAYSDGDQAQGQAPAFAGHSAYRLTSEFVNAPALVGNAEQYASALGVIVRKTIAIPSRVVMGFQATGTDAGPVTITGEQVDAWVEVPVDGVGWVAVLPTPDRDDTALKQKSPSPPQPEYETQVPPPPPMLDPEFDQPAQSKTGAKTTRKAEDAAAPTNQASIDAGNGGGLPLAAAIGVGVVTTPLVLLLLLAAAVVATKWLRRRRRRRRGPAHERIANGWREVTDAALDMGRPVPPSATRREAAGFLHPSTLVLAQRADAAVFGATQPSDGEVDAFWQEMEQLLATVRSELGLRGRLRAAVSASSLRAGRTSRRMQRGGPTERAPGRRRRGRAKGPQER